MRVHIGDLAPKGLLYLGLGIVGPALPPECDPITGCPDSDVVLPFPAATGAGPALPPGCDPVLGCPGGPDGQATCLPPNVWIPAANGLGAGCAAPQPGQFITGISNNVLIAGVVGIVVVFMMMGGRR